MQIAKTKELIFQNSVDLKRWLLNQYNPETMKLKSVDEDISRSSGNTTITVVYEIMQDVETADILASILDVYYLPVDDILNKLNDKFHLHVYPENNTAILFKLIKLVQELEKNA